MAFPVAYMLFKYPLRRAKIRRYRSYEGAHSAQINIQGLGGYSICYLTRRERRAKKRFERYLAAGYNPRWTLNE